MSRFLQYAVSAFCLCLMLLGVAIFAFSLRDYTAVKNLVSHALSAQGAARFTPAFFSSLVFKLRILAGGLFLLSVVGLWQRSRIAGRISVIAGNMVMGARHFRQHVLTPIFADSLQHRFTLLTIIVIGILVRARSINGSMRCDEATTFTQYASRPFLIGVSNYSQPNNHLLHTLLLHLCYLFGGQREWVLRIPAFFAGALVIALTYILARQIRGRNAALLSTAFVSVSSVLVEYSVTARGYTLLIDFVLLAAILGWLIAHCEFSAERRGLWSFQAVSIVLGFFTMPTMLYAYGGLVIWTIWICCSNPKTPGKLPFLREAIAALMGTVFLTLFCYSPALIVSGLSSFVSNATITEQTHMLSGIAQMAPTYLASVATLWMRDLPSGVVIVIVIGLILEFVPLPRANRGDAQLAIFMIVWIIFVVVVQRVIPFERSLLFLLPVMLIIASCGLVTLGGLVTHPALFDRTASIAAIVLVCFVGARFVTRNVIFNSDGTGTMRDASAVTSYLNNILQPGDRVVARSPSLEPLEYYFQQRGLDRDFLYHDINHSSRIYLVVYEPSADRPIVPTEMLQVAQHVAELRKDFGLIGDAYGPERLVRRFSESAVYEIDIRRNLVCVP